jgi:hypothetical protein
MIPGTRGIHSSGRGHIKEECVHYCKGQSRDIRDYNPFHISSGSEVETKYKDHIIEEMEVEDERDMGPGEDYPEGSGGGIE